MTINLAGDFARMLCGQIHTSYTTAPGNLGYIASALTYLNPLGPGTGLWTERDDTTGKVSGLVGLGCNLDIYIAYPGAAGSTLHAADFLTPMKTLVATGRVKLLEGPLEVDNSGWGMATHTAYVDAAGASHTGWAGVTACQKDLWTAFSGQAPIAMPSSAVPANGVAGGPFAPCLPYGNVGNIHFYPHNGQAALVELAGTVAQETGYCQALPKAITETGFNDATGSSIGGNVLGTAAVNAKYTLNMLLDCFAAGITLTSYYEMFDDPGRSGFEAHWGLFTSTGQPKASATALRNMLGVLGDAGATAGTFTPTPYPVTVTGLPANGNWLQFQRADGTQIIVAWVDQTIYAGGKLTTAANRAVTVTLPAAANSNVYDPTVGPSPIASPTGATITLTLSDHPQIVVVPPNGVVVVPPVTPPPVVPPPVIPPVTPPPVVPPPVVPPVTPPATPSKEGTTITGPNQPLIDTTGNTYTLINQGQSGGPRLSVMPAGGTTPMAATGWGVARAFVFNGQVWQENASNMLWSRTLPTDAWAPTAGVAEHAFIATVMAALSIR